MNDLSPLALAILVKANAGLNISAESVMSHWQIGRHSALKALKELREFGYIELKTQKIGASIVKKNYLTVLGSDRLTAELSLPLVVQNSNNSVFANSLISKPDTPTPSVEEFQTINIEVNSMGYEFFEKQSSIDDDEVLKARQKTQDAKKSEYEDAKAKSHKKRLSRHSVPAEKWTCTDVGYEFADRIYRVWSIKPWSVTNSRFIPALATLRKKHDTNGAVEVAILDLFFGSIDFEKYDDAEHLWKLFVTRFPSYVLQAKSSMISTEESDEELRLKEKALARLRGNV